MSENSEHRSGGSPRRVAMITSGVRPEEKMLVQAFQARAVELTLVDDRQIHGSLGAWPGGLPEADVVLLRSKSHWRNVTLARWLEGRGARVVNGSHVLETCGDKVLTTLALVAADVPTVDAHVAFATGSGLTAGRSMGFPLVVKPVIGSWGRLIGKVNDDDALEAVLDHKEALGGSPHAVTYLQPYVEKRGSDLRSFVVDGRCIAAIERTADHWKTNTALGARASARSVDGELAAISEAAAAAVGGGAVAVDLFERDEGYVVNEVNGTMEFRNSVSTTGVDIPGHIADYALRGTGDADVATAADRSRVA